MKGAVCLWGNMMHQGRGLLLEYLLCFDVSFMHEECTASMHQRGVLGLSGSELHGSSLTCRPLHTVGCSLAAFLMNCCMFLQGQTANAARVFGPLY